MILKKPQDHQQPCKETFFSMCWIFSSLFCKGDTSTQNPGKLHINSSHHGFSQKCAPVHAGGCVLLKIPSQPWMGTMSEVVGSLFWRELMGSPTLLLPREEHPKSCPPPSTHLLSYAPPCIFSTMRLLLDGDELPTKSLQSKTTTTKSPVLPSSNLSWLSWKMAIR